MCAAVRQSSLFYHPPIGAVLRKVYEAMDIRMRRRPCNAGWEGEYEYTNQITSWGQKQFKPHAAVGAALCTFSGPVQLVQSAVQMVPQRL